jgi:hypothetical protein
LDEEVDEDEVVLDDDDETRVFLFCIFPRRRFWRESGAGLCSGATSSSTDGRRFLPL